MGIIDLPSPAAGYLDEQFNDLIGHTKASTTGIFGILPKGILSQRVEMIEAVTHFLVVGLFDACSPPSSTCAQKLISRYRSER